MIVIQIDAVKLIGLVVVLAILLLLAIAWLLDRIADIRYKRRKRRDRDTPPT